LQVAVTARAGNLIIVGLEEKNLEKLRAGQPFHHHMQEVGAPFELVIFYGKDMADLETIIKTGCGPDTVEIDHRNRKKN